MTVRLFNYPESITHKYSRRYCFRLARVLRSLLGGSVYAVTTDTYTHIHYVVMYNSCYIDIIGIYTQESEVLDYWRVQRPDINVSRLSLVTVKN